MIRRVGLCMMLVLAVWATANHALPGSARAEEPAVDNRLAADEAGRAAKEVYSGPAFWWKRRGEVQTPNLGPLDGVRRFFAWIIENIVAAFRWLWDTLWWLLSKLFSGLGLPSIQGVGSLPRLVLLGLVAALATGALVWYLARYLSGRKGGPAGIAGLDDSLAPERLPDAVVLLEKAKAALAGDDYFQALRLGFLAVLAALQQRQLLRYDRSRTNGEYYRDLRGQPRLANGFRMVAAPFDRACYGRIRPGRSDAEQAIALCEDCLEEEAEL